MINYNVILLFNFSTLEIIKKIYVSSYIGKSRSIHMFVLGFIKNAVQKCLRVGKIWAAKLDVRTVSLRKFNNSHPVYFYTISKIPSW